MLARLAVTMRTTLGSSPSTLEGSAPALRQRGAGGKGTLNRSNLPSRLDASAVYLPRSGSLRAGDEADSANNLNFANTAARAFAKLRRLRHTTPTRAAPLVKRVSRSLHINPDRHRPWATADDAQPADLIMDRLQLKALGVRKTHKFITDKGPVTRALGEWLSGAADAYERLLQGVLPNHHQRPRRLGLFTEDPNPSASTTAHTALHADGAAATAAAAAALVTAGPTV